MSAVGMRSMRQEPLRVIIPLIRVEGLVSGLDRSPRGEGQRQEGPGAVEVLEGG